jgi:hypothetical protein
VRAAVTAGPGCDGSGSVRRLLGQRQEVTVLDRRSLHHTAGDEAELLR